MVVRFGLMALSLCSAQYIFRQTRKKADGFTATVRRPTHPYAVIHVRDAEAWRQAFATSATARWWSHQVTDKPKAYIQDHSFASAVLLPENGESWVREHINEWWVHYDLGSDITDNYNRDLSYVLQVPAAAPIDDLAKACRLVEKDGAFYVENVENSTSRRLHHDGSGQWLF